MKILFLSTEIPYPLNDGHHLRTYNILKILARSNDIHFVAFIKEFSELQHLEQIRHLIINSDIFRLRSGRNGLSFYFDLVRNLFSQYPYITQRYFSSEASHRIRQIIETEKIDLVHFDMLHLTKYKAIANGLPNVLTNHNVESLRVSRLAQVERNPIKQWFINHQYKKLYRFEKKTCPLFRRCIVVSENDRQILESLCGSRNFVAVPNGVDTQYFQARPLEIQPDSMVWVGNMADAYNRDAVTFFMRQIYPLIKIKNPGCRITFVGGNPPGEITRQSTKDETVITTGFVEDIRPYVNNAAVFIAPLRSGSGTKVKVLNAMAQGKAVVTTSIGGEGIDARDGEELFIADEPQEFADRVLLLLENPHLAVETGRRARKAIENKYDWKMIATQINKLYNDILSESVIKSV